MAHAVHPNYADKHEPGHKPRFGDGVVIKHNANQRYATDAVTAWLFRELGERAGVPVQVSGVFIFTYRVITYSRSATMGDWTDALCFVLTRITGVCRSLRPRVRQHHRAYSVHQDRDTDGGRGGAAAVDAQRQGDVRHGGHRRVFPTLPRVFRSLRGDRRERRRRRLTILNTTVRYVVTIILISARAYDSRP